MNIANSTVQERLIEELAKLSENRLQEVLDFVGYLLSKEQKEQTAEPEQDLAPAKDPLLKFIAGVSHGSLAKGIDRELYGEER